MPLIVEDGSGLAVADCLVAPDFADRYHEARGRRIWAETPAPAREAALIRASDYLDCAYRYRGARLSDVQALEWPRIDAYDDDGAALLAVPLALRRACAELALRALSEDLMADLDRTGRVTRRRQLVAGEAIPPEEGPPGRRYIFVDHLVRGLIRLPDRALAAL